MKIFYYLRFFSSSSFYRSFRLLFYLNSKNRTDVLYYYPQHFNSEIGYPLFLSPLIKSTQSRELSQIIIEEPNIFVKENRSKNVEPFDFIWLLVLVLRKLYRGNDYDVIDVKVGKLLSKVLFINREVKNIITVSQSFQSIFRGMFPKATLYDYQHGLISTKYYGYINGDSVAEHITNNQSNVLLYGQGFRNKLLQIRGGEYFQDHSFVIGSIYKEFKKPRKSSNGNVLFTLQFTESHSDEFNKNLLSKTIELFEIIKSQNLNLTLYLKSHPRFDKCINTTKLYEYSFVRVAPQNLNDCFKLCSLHVTEYSSVLFDAIIEGIPTLLTSFTEEMDIYEKEYFFPSLKLSFIDSLKKIQDDDFYKKMIDEQIKWSKHLYEPFNDKHFIDAIK
jgi:hypothetical protein